MKLQKSPFISFVIMISACSQNMNLCGEYNSKRTMNKKSSRYIYATGTTLKLNCNSSFNMTTCGNIIEGKWLQKNDSIILMNNSNRFRNDSLAKIKTPTIKKEIILIRNNKDELLNIIDSNYNGQILVDLLEMK